MSCAFYQYLSPFLDGELDSLKAKRIKEHVDTCELCQRELNLMQEIRNSLRQGADSIKAPSHLREKIMGETHQRKRLVFIPRWTFAYATGLVAVLLVVCIMLLYYRPMDRDLFSDVVGTLVTYHDDYASGKRSLAIKSSAWQNTESWIEEKLGFKAPIPHAAFAGYSLKGADAFEQKGRKFAYLKYQEEGNIIGYIIFKDSALSIDLPETVTVGKIELQIGKKEETNMAVWKKEGLVHIILTTQDRSELLSYAQRCIELF